MNKFLEYAEISELGDIANNQADLLHNADYQASNKVSLVLGNQVSNQAGGIAGNQVSNQANLLHSTENQELEIIRLIDGNQVDTIVRGIASGITGSLTNQQIGLLNFCKEVKFRDELFQFLNLAKHPTNFKLHIKPLIDIN
ncbi:MAG TPA: hypothetical protein PLB87_05860 [Prolixibacteraceae bacterium]|nr:hypothetical protein [Prolixibacteraceae bacterium]